MAGWVEGEYGVAKTAFRRTMAGRRMAASATGLAPALTREASSRRGGKKPNSYVQPSTVEMLAGTSPASAMDGWAE